MAYIATKTVKYQTKPGSLFDLKEGEEVAAHGFDLEELRRGGVVKKKNLIDKVKDKVEASKAKKAAAKAEAKAAKPEAAEAESGIPM